MQLPRPQLAQLLRPPAVPGVAVHRVLGPVPPRPAAGRGLQGLQGALAQSAAAHVSLGGRGHVSRVWLPRVVAVSPRLRAPDTHQLRAELSLPRGGDGVGGAGSKLYVTCILICFQYIPKMSMSNEYIICCLPDPAVLCDCPGRVPPLVPALDVGPEHVRQS